MNELTRMHTVEKNKPVSITVDIKPVNWLHKYLQSKSLVKKHKTFLISETNIYSVIAISRIMLSIDTNLLDREKLLQSNYQIADPLSKKLAKCIAISIHNNKGHAPQSLIDFVLRNFIMSEMFAVLEVVRRQMNISSFMSSIILITGINMLESRAPVSTEKVIN